MNHVRRATRGGLLLSLAALSGCTSAPKPDEVRVLVNAAAERSAAGEVLDQLHTSAAKADLLAYMNCYALDAVFIGTDAGERWNRAEFEAYCKHYFDQGKGWSYAPSRRAVMVSLDGQFAWFDELLTHEKYGTCRGTGVLRKGGTKWQVVQYHLTIPVPNAIAGRVVDMIRASKGPG